MSESKRGRNADNMNKLSLTPFRHLIFWNTAASYLLYAPIA